MNQVFAWKEETLSASDGTRLFLRSHSTVDSGRTVLIIHGLGEHSGRYDPLAKMLCENRFSVYAPDLRGHGKSAGQRGHIDTWHQYLEDVQTCVAHIRHDHPKNRLILVGHSLGSLIALSAILENPEKFSACIISAPCLELAKPPRPALMSIIAFLNRIFPRVPLKNQVDPKTLSHIDQEVHAYRKDSLVHGWITPRLFTEIVRSIARVRRRAAEYTLPTLMLIPGADPIFTTKGSRMWFDILGSEKKTFKLYPSAYHELFNEKERPQVFNDLLTWIDKHVYPVATDKGP